MQGNMQGPTYVYIFALKTLKLALQREQDGLSRSNQVAANINVVTVSLNTK